MTQNKILDEIIRYLESPKELVDFLFSVLEKDKTEKTNTLSPALKKIQIENQIDLCALFKKCIQSDVSPLKVLKVSCKILPKKSRDTLFKYVC